MAEKALKLIYKELQKNSFEKGRTKDLENQIKMIIYQRSVYYYNKNQHINLNFDKDMEDYNNEVARLERIRIKMVQELKAKGIDRPNVPSMPFPQIPRKLEEPVRPTFP